MRIHQMTTTTDVAEHPHEETVEEAEAAVVVEVVVDVEAAVEAIPAARTMILTCRKTIGTSHFHPHGTFASNDDRIGR